MVKFQLQEKNTSQWFLNLHWSYDFLNINANLWHLYIPGIPETFSLTGL